MKELAQRACEVCRAGAALVTEAEAKELLLQIPEWSISKAEKVERLSRVFSFTDFKEALGFTNSVGEIAEAEAHHPSITTEYGKVTIEWWTHKIGGLHVNDFVMAAKTDRLYGLPA